MVHASVVHTAIQKWMSADCSFKFTAPPLHLSNVNTADFKEMLTTV
jgi:hypothetical protein